jgi:hypothetical protein
MKSVARENLENLVKIKQLKKESGTQEEVEGLVSSAKPRLKDAGNQALSLESRFDLGDNAAHSLALAALRWHGYRSENRFTVFQCLQFTLDFPANKWRVLDEAHRKRNNAEYSGVVDINQATVEGLIQIAHEILEKVIGLGAVRRILS